ncbi:MAG: acyl-ACP--UDP-N-acetylglucosamine O-acyltransferase [Candidatus Omnitrophica bacterium]|nr:acyl-ACP--UDP-N-acetylglucosamine O-acyltransferase [Candidatus Omnitrophota bacterium]
MDSDAAVIHPSAIVHPGAQLGRGVTVGPYAVIGEHVTIGDRTAIGTHCVIDGYTAIGESCQFFTGAVIGSIPQDLKYQGEPSHLVIGDRNRIREYVTINPGTAGGGSQTVIGDDNLLMAYAHIAHDCLIGNNIIIANNGTLAGHITVEDRAVIGGLSAIHQFVRVGELAIVGGCSKVVQDIPPYSTCDGHPAKVYGVNHEGLRRANVSTEVENHLKAAFKILFHSGLTVSHAAHQLERNLPPVREVQHLVEFIRASKRGLCASVTRARGVRSAVSQA